LAFLQQRSFSGLASSLAIFVLKEHIPSFVKRTWKCVELHARFSSILAFQGALKLDPLPNHYTGKRIW